MNFRAPKNVRFECQRCARCCGDTPHRGRNILLMESEVERISKHTGLSPQFFASPLSNSGYYRYKMKKRNGKCVFLEGKACRIYDIRPLICRFYPFSVRKVNNTYVFEVAEECPGVGLGETLGKEKFENMIMEFNSKLKAG